MRQWGYLNQAIQLSWTLLFSLLLPLLGGVWLDKKLGTSPLFILIGALLGILAATVGVARMVMRMFPQTEDSSSELPEFDAEGEEEQP